MTGSGRTSGIMQRVDLWGIPALLALAMLSNASMVPLVPFALATRLGWPLWLVGLYSFAVMATTMIVNRRFSALVDSAKRRSFLLLLCGLFQVVGALAGIGALNGIVPLLALTAVGTAIGGAAAPIYYTVGRLITQEAGHSPASINSILRVVTSAAWVAGPAIGFAIAGSLGISAAFVGVAVMAGAGAAAVLVASSWLDAQAQRAAEQAEAKHAQNDASRGTGPTGSYLQIATFLVVFLFSLSHIATATSLPLLLVRRFSVPESAAGLLLALKAATEMVVILLTPVLARRWGPVSLLTIAGGGAIIAYSSYLFGSSLGWAVFAAVCEGAYYGIFAVTALTWVQSLPGMRLGRSTGFYMNGIYAGVLIGAPLSGVVASINLGWIAGLSLLSAVAAAVVLRSAFRTPRGPSIE